MTESNKKKFGQYYTTNCDYILSNIKIPHGAKLVEPFVGQGDLVKWSKRTDWELYDIEPKCSAITQDTLLNPPDYKDKYPVTNPPFLAKNKNKDKRVYEKYGVDDLYKACIKSFVDGDVAGGILIIPLNFFCDRDKNIRDIFFERYNVDEVNVFEETVFDDTTYTICSFSFTRGRYQNDTTFHFYPSKTSKVFELKKEHGWRVGGGLFKKTETKYKLGRLLEGQEPSTMIFLNAIDTGSEEGRIRLIANHELFYDNTPNRSNRAFATITSNIKIIDEQLIVDKFNKRLETLRETYNSLFLVNYRNSTKNYARKRISFKQCYMLLIEILEEYNKEE
jgi:hypothetical protein